MNPCYSCLNFDPLEFLAPFYSERKTNPAKDVSRQGGMG